MADQRHTLSFAGADAAADAEEEEEEQQRETGDAERGGVDGGAAPAEGRTRPAAGAVPSAVLRVVARRVRSEERARAADAAASFPVPTASNPNAVFVGSASRPGEDGAAPQLDASSDARRARLSEIRAQLARGRAENHARALREHEQLADPDAFRKRCKRAEAERDAAERAREAEVLGVPADRMDLLDTAAYAKRRAEESVAETLAAARSYEKAVQRQTARGAAGAAPESGAQTLAQHLAERHAQSVKKRAAASRSAAAATDPYAVNRTNARFNRELGKAFGKEAQVQAIKQNLERGTAL